MASKQPPRPRMRASRKADNFLLIKGIGPAIFNRLHTAGIKTYTQLVSLSPTELAERVPGLSSKLIARQNWIGQAHMLASNKTSSRSHKKTGTTPVVRQHYENFTIEFLLDQKNVMRRTRILHIQSGNVDTWSGWNVGQLTDFLILYAGMRLPAPESPIQKKNFDHERPLHAIKEQTDLSVVSSPDSVSPLLAGFEVVQPSVEASTSVSHPAAEVYITGRLRLRDLKIMLDGSDTSVLCLHHDQPYQVHLALDLADVTAPSGTPIRYKAAINFTQFGGPCHAACTATGTLITADNLTLTIAGTILTPGTYRLDAYVLLTANEAATGLASFLKGNLVQVY